MAKCKSLLTKSNNSIYTDVWEIVGNYSDLFLYIFIGGRGKGKTYSSLKKYVNDNQEKFLYIRRTESEIKNCCNEHFNPFKAINEDFNTNIQMMKQGDYVTINNVLDPKAKEYIHMGYAGALSTFGKLRGADFSDIDTILFDEFINTSPVNTLKREAFLLFNLIETVNRNRELKGKESVKVILLSNSNTIDDDIIRTLGLADKVREMKLNDEGLYIDQERGIFFQILKRGKFEDFKEQTRLYQLTKGTTFYDMALENEFTADYFGDVRKVKYNELEPLVNYDNIYFYSHKGSGVLYASKRKCNCSKYNNRNNQAFKRDYGYLIGNAIERGRILYQDYDVKLNVFHIFKN